MTEKINVFLIAEGYVRGKTGMHLDKCAQRLSKQEGILVRVYSTFDATKPDLVGLQGPRRFVFFSQKPHDAVAAHAAAVQRSARVIVFTREKGSEEHAKNVLTMVDYEHAPIDTEGYPLVYDHGLFSKENLRALIR